MKQKSYRHYIDLIKNIDNEIVSVDDSWWKKHEINEAATAPLYHGTTFQNAMEIFMNQCLNKFRYLVYLYLDF